MWMKALALVCLSASAAAQQHRIGVAKYELPKYPPIAKAARLQGTVVMKFLLNPDGSIKESEVISGHPMFVAAVSESAKAWRFTCMDCAYGERFEHRVEFRFVIDGDSSDLEYELRFPTGVTIRTRLQNTQEVCCDCGVEISIPARWPMAPSENSSRLYPGRRR